MSPRWRTPAALVLLLALTAGFYWKLTISRQWSFLEAPDLANQVRPWLDFQAREFHAGRFPLWDPYEWGGHALIGQDQPGATNPLNWILFAMPLPDGHLPVTTLHWYWVLIHWLGAAFAFALCRDLKCGYAASLLGGSIFALTGFMGHTDWPQVLMAAVWIPLVLLFFARVVRNEKPRSSAALCGAALGMSFLGTHPAVPIFTAVLVGALWLAHIVPDWRRGKYLAIFSAVFLAVAAAQLLPSMEYGKLALRWAGAPEPLHWNERVPFSEHARFSLGWSSLPGIVIPGPSLNANPFVGIVAVVLAAAAIWRRRKERMVLWFAAVAAGGLLLALGSDFPPYWLLWRLVPGVEKAHEPAFAIVLFQAGIAALAALGLGVLRRPWIAWLALALFLVEAVNDAAHLSRIDRPGSSAQMIESQQDIAGFLKSQPGWFRVDFDENDVPYNFGDFYGIEQFGGLVSSMPESTHHLLGREETPARFGVRYHVGRIPSSPTQQEVFRSRSGVKVFRDARIGDPLWALRTEPCPGADQFTSVSRTPNAATVDTDLACPGLLVTGDAFYPGWRARVDGRRAPVQEVYATRAVRLDAGRHRVEFFYRPASVYWGFGSALAGLLLASALVVLDLRRACESAHG